MRDFSEGPPLGNLAFAIYMMDLGYPVAGLLVASSDVHIDGSDSVIFVGHCVAGCRVVAVRWTGDGA